MMTSQFLRIVPTPDEPWDGTRAIMLSTKGDWCLYEWKGPDRLLWLDYFDSEGTFVTWEAFMFSTNPLPTMWDEGKTSSDELWICADRVAV